MTNRFLQIHTFTSYPGVLLNRDDVGFAKRLPFGGHVRTRISSQCLKRHWRTHEGPDALSSLEQPMSVRSRRTFQVEILEPLLRDGADETVATAVVTALMNQVLGKSPKKSNKDDKGLESGQVTVLGRPEVEYIRKLAAELIEEADDEKSAKKAAKEAFKDRDLKANLKSLAAAAGLDAAMFGRMVTGSILARGDAAVHVAHAFTVHAEEDEADYFSAVDDLNPDGDSGSGHIGSTELTSGLFYSYVVVDLPLLVSNLEGVDTSAWTDADRSLAADVVGKLLRLICTVSPGAKKGSTAPYAYAQLMFVELGDEQPRTLANAFQAPVTLGSDVLDGAMNRMADHWRAIDRMVPSESDQRWAIGIGDLERFCGATRSQDAGSLPALVEAVSDAVRS